MVKSGWVAISYCFVFAFVYLAYLGYALIPAFLNKIGNDVQMPMSSAQMNVYNMTTSLSSFSTGSWLAVAIIALIVMIVLSMFSMRAAY